MGRTESKKRQQNGGNVNKVSSGDSEDNRGEDTKGESIGTKHNGRDYEGRSDSGNEDSSSDSKECENSNFGDNKDNGDSKQNSDGNDDTSSSEEDEAWDTKELLVGTGRITVEKMLDSTHLYTARDFAALRKTMQEQGYLLLRNFLDVTGVNTARARIVGTLLPPSSLCVVGVYACMCVYMCVYI